MFERIIAFLPSADIIVIGLIGGVIRVVIGYLSAADNEKFNWKKATKTILIFMFFSFLVITVAGPESLGFALLLGYGGDDAFNALYRKKVGKGFGESILGQPGTGLSASIPQDLNDRQRSGYDFILKYGKITNDQYQKLNKISNSPAKRDLVQMTKRKTIKSYGKNKGIYYKLS